jgi:hypothetical protein
MRQAAATMKKEKKKREKSPALLTFESQSLLRKFPEVDLKLLILRVLNQQVMNTHPYNRALQDELVARFDDKYSSSA